MSFDIFNKSVIVAAHPDDEILWFSSLLNDVDHVLICYLGEMINPDFGLQRQRALSKIQFGNKLSCLEVISLGVTRPRSFLSPKFYQDKTELTNEYGNLDKFNDSYKKNYYKLRTKLAIALVGYKNVVTHNPWGEYGHVEHVQVYRVVKELQKDMGFNIWFSNYCSTRTMELTKPIINATEVVTFSTNVEIAKAAMDIYKESDCWTWYEDWHWAEEETFFKQAKSSSEDIALGTMLSLNLIVMPKLEPRAVSSSSILGKLKHKLSNIL